MRWILCAALVLGGWLSPARAYSSKEHILLTRIAAERLIADASTPLAMKAWLTEIIGGAQGSERQREYLLFKRVGPFARGADGLMFWSVMPDLEPLQRRDERSFPPFPVPEAKLHYLDVELFNPDPAKRRYADDLSHKPALGDFPHDMDDGRYQAAGMLPFAVEYYYRRVVSSLGEGRLSDRPGQFPRDDHAARWAGILSHYLEDNMQPQHGTVDYKSRSYFPDSAHAPDVHADMEFRLVDDEEHDYPELRKELWDLLVKTLAEMKDPVDTKDLWRATVETTLTSYDALPMIGRAAREAHPQASAQGPGKWDAEKFCHCRGQYQGREMTVLQMRAWQYAWAVKRVERVLRQAWDEGGANQAASTRPVGAERR